MLERRDGLTRYSFSRTMLRRAAADGWTARRARSRHPGRDAGHLDQHLAMTLGHTILVTETGCERLSRFSLDPIVK